MKKEVNPATAIIVIVVVVAIVAILVWKFTGQKSGGQTANGTAVMDLMMKAKAKMGLQSPETNATTSNTTTTPSN